MTTTELHQFFRSVWLVDFEFYQPDGERPSPLCFVAKELYGGTTIRRWAPFDATPPYGVGEDDLFVSYFSTAELGCHITLGWPMPERVLDLYAEFRRHVCGLTVPNGYGLLGALAYFGLNGLETATKAEMRSLAMSGRPCTEEEKKLLLEYCETDVIALEHLLPKLLPDLDLPRALIRGKYVSALAHVEWRGVPIDMPRYRLLQDKWEELQLSLIQSIDQNFGVYKGRTFKRDQFVAWCQAHGIPWPALASGEPALDEDTFRDQARLYPILNPLKELRSSLSQMRLNELKIGHDGRNRCLLSPFASRTSRNQPSNTAFIFGPAVCRRRQPAPNHLRQLTGRHDDVPPAWTGGQIWIQQMTLRCENLSKSFDGTRALADLTLEFPASGIVAIIGPNGAGKTTLVNVLTGFLRAESGRIFLNEQELTGLAPHKIARLGIARTFQDLRLISQVSVLENVLLARPNQKGEKLLPALFRFGVAVEEARNHDEAMRWLKFVGLDSAAEELAGELSYGQQKLLTLACCLATDARILLLDEPVAGVHPDMVQKILNLLGQLRDSGKRIVFIEHDIASVRQVADRVIVMDHGKIIAQGKPGEVLEKPEIIEAYVG